MTKSPAAKLLTPRELAQRTALIKTIHLISDNPYSSVAAKAFSEFIKAIF
jgi:hypothetical protein